MEYINGKSEVCFATFEDEHYKYAYNQALKDFAKWVNENQMKEFIIDIMIANKGDSNIEDLIKLYLSK